jgi:hypothetical protein
VQLVTVSHTSVTVNTVSPATSPARQSAASRRPCRASPARCPVTPARQTARYAWRASEEAAYVTDAQRSHVQQVLAHSPTCSRSERSRQEVHNEGTKCLIAPCFLRFTCSLSVMASRQQIGAEGPGNGQYLVVQSIGTASLLSHVARAPPALPRTAAVNPFSLFPPSLFPYVAGMWPHLTLFFGSHLPIRLIASSLIFLPRVLRRVPRSTRHLPVRRVLRRLLRCVLWVRLFRCALCSIEVCAS